MEKENKKLIFENFFKFVDGTLKVEEVDITDISKKYKTPTYIYSKNYISSQIKKLKDAFADTDTLICYSVKANSNIHILKSIEKEGCGADVVSEGELRGALLAGFPPQKIVFAGVGKSEEEISFGIKQKIHSFNIENEEELYLLEKYGRDNKEKIKCNLRLNLDIDVDTHHYIKTSKKENKFGISLESVEKLLKKEFKYLHINGFHFHLGSQIKEVAPYIEGLKRIKEFSKKVGFQPETINIGGGFGITYSPEEKPLNIYNFGKKVTQFINNMGIKKLIIEPGRFIIGNTGILVTKILYIKKRGEKTFIIVDAAMNDLIRPALYGSYHEILPVKKGEERANIIKADIVGPICETGDYLGKDIKIPDNIKEGDLLGILSAGAYSFSMSSNYNSRLKPCELLIDRDKTYLIRERESYKDLWGK